MTLVWWHNAKQGAGMKLWDRWPSSSAAPGVTIKVVPLQNEQFTTKIPIALQSNSPPDVFQNWGGGGLVDQVKAGKVADLTKYVQPWIKSIGGSAAGWQVNGKQYAIPYSVGVVGFWYNKAALHEGRDHVGAEDVAAVPRRDRQAEGGGHHADRDRQQGQVARRVLLGLPRDEAVQQDRRCSRRPSRTTSRNPCWLKAGQYTQQLLDAEPFQDGFLATPAQQGATSSAGLVANGKAAMELQGHWNPGVMQPLTPDNKIPSFLGWFPFPNVPGSKALPGSLLGGGDGFACSWKAPQPACAQFLTYIDSPSVQRRIGATNFGLPVRKGTESSVKDPNLRTVLEVPLGVAVHPALPRQAYSTAIGQALDDAIADQFAGKATPAQVVDKIAAAAKKK